MRASVRRAFVPFTVALEGAVRWMYLDILGLVTTAIGNLVDPVGLVVGVPFVRRDGTPATAAEIVAEWQRVKVQSCIAAKEFTGKECGWRGHRDRACLAHLGHRAAELVTVLRLTPAGVDQVVYRKLDEHDAALVARWPDMLNWPADAQLAVHSMAWACGSGFHSGRRGFPRLAAALDARDFERATMECHIDETGADRIKGTFDDNRGLVERNAANKILFRNAAIIQGAHLDYDELHYPANLAAIEQDETPTEPRLQSVPGMPAVEAPLPRLPLSGEAAEEFLGLPRRYEDE